MAEMNFLARYFVNRSAARRAVKRLDWIRRRSAIPPGAVCLEIGCGNGEFAGRFVLEFRPVRYVATDLDARQLEEADRTLRSRHPASLGAGLELQSADMRHLPFPAGMFDVVLAFVALHHAGPVHGDFAPVTGALSEVDRVLRPNGLLVYSELFHKEAIRGWLTGHGFALEAVDRRWRIESVAARKGPARP